MDTYVLPHVFPLLRLSSDCKPCGVESLYEDLSQVLQPFLQNAALFFHCVTGILLPEGALTTAYSDAYIHTCTGVVCVSEFMCMYKYVYNIMVNMYVV